MYGEIVACYYWDTMPGGTTSNQFYYVYTLESLTDGKRYIGYTQDLRKRLEEHNSGKSIATAPRRPFRLVYYEACLERSDAIRRERYMKTTDGRRFMSKRLRDHIALRNSK